MEVEQNSKGVFSLAQWNQEAVASPSIIMSQDPSLATLLFDSSVSFDSPPKVVPRPAPSRGMHGRRCASVNSIMGTPIPEEADTLIDDANIANINLLFLSRAGVVVCDSFEFGDVICGIRESVVPIY